MNRLIGAAALCLTVGYVATADAQVSVNIGVPGVYGRVDIGGYPSPPPVLYRQPVYAERGPSRDAPPLYLHVPPGHEKHWRQHCAEYEACGRPVYFVRHDWYRDVYARRDGPGRRDDRHDDRGGPRDDRDHRDDRRDGERHDNGQGRGRN